MKTRISILGSTGSIGQQTADIVRALPDKFEITGLSARKNVKVLAQQIKEFKPQVASVYSDEELLQLKKLIGSGVKTDLVVGHDGLVNVATVDSATIVLVSLVGIVGLLPTLEAIKAKKTIALANKETLVAGGSLVIPEALKNNVQIIPVDSEHSAIFQCIASNPKKAVKNITITASGGPFRGWNRQDIANATKEQALKHPNWDMGPKVSIDSATLMNKTLEIIEAKWLFDIDYSNINVVIHPQSIVHSMVEFVDGSVIAQLGNPSMHLPIQYALCYPERVDSGLVEPLDLVKIGNLEFNKPDDQNFPCVTLAYKAGNIGGTSPVVLNASNEIAVNAYINDQISFYDIYDVVNSCIDNHQTVLNPSLEDILAADQWARDYAQKYLLLVKTK
ncbi:MAG: 1-deoxy-D-xylulose-5-phosphate reductoisomerase [Vampirovibrionia bacterium]